MTDPTLTSSSPAAAGDAGAAAPLVPDTDSGLALAAWRRTIHGLYRQVREATDLEAAHDLWRRTRDELFTTNPVTPLLPETTVVRRVAQGCPTWFFPSGAV